MTTYEPCFLRMELEEWTTIDIPDDAIQVEVDFDVVQSESPGIGGGDPDPTVMVEVSYLEPSSG